MKGFATIFTLIAAMVFTGCANQMNTMVAPRYQSKTTTVESIGLTGPGASAAFPAFVSRGYNVVDIPGAPEDPIETAKKKNVPFLATVDKVGTEGSWWAGIFNFSMRVTDTASGSIVWSATADFGTGGATISQMKSTTNAMHSMVKSFSTNFPPK